MLKFYFFFFSSRRRHTRLQGDWSSDVCSSDLLELPYASGELVMDVVLPAERDGLPEIERQFAGGGLRGWLDVLKTARVDVTLLRASRPPRRSSWRRRLAGSAWPRRSDIGTPTSPAWTAHASCSSRRWRTRPSSTSTNTARKRRRRLRWG